MKKMLGFEEALKQVRILVEYEVNSNTSFYRLVLIYPDKEMEVPVVYHKSAGILMTPWDWQEQLPVHPDGIADVDWRARNSQDKALIIDGLPYPPFWQP